MKQVTAGIIIDRGKVFIARRGPNSTLPGSWEFPGGKIETGETPEECLERELREEFHVEVQVGALYCESTYHYDHGAIKLLCYLTCHVSGEFIPTVHDEFTWAAFDELRDYDFAPADVPVVEKIIEDYCSLTQGED
jgi:8-oxo-dGTP diphosphatase